MPVTPHHAAPKLGGLAAMSLALTNVANEMMRHDSLKAAGRFTHVMSDPEMSDFERITAIGEEYGEVCRAAYNVAGLATDIPDSYGTNYIDPVTRVEAWNRETPGFRVGYWKQELEKEITQIAALAAKWLSGLQDTTNYPLGTTTPPWEKESA